MTILAGTCVSPSEATYVCVFETFTFRPLLSLSCTNTLTNSLSFSWESAINAVSSAYPSLFMFLPPPYTPASQCNSFGIISQYMLSWFGEKTHPCLTPFLITCQNLLKIIRRLKSSGPFMQWYFWNVCKFWKFLDEVFNFIELFQVPQARYKTGTGNKLPKSFRMYLCDKNVKLFE